VEFFVLIVVFAALTGGAPAATDPGADVVDYVTTNQGRLQGAAVVAGFAMVAALWWVGGLSQALRRAGDGDPGLALTALAGGALAAAAMVTNALILGTVATDIEELGADGVGVWWTMSRLSFGAVLFGLLVVITATTWAAVQWHLFRPWFRWAGVALAIASAFGAATIGFDAAGIQVVAGIAILLDSVWILLVSLDLWRDPTLAAPPR
jgi:hypothetical protein